MFNLLPRKTRQNGANQWSLFVPSGAGVLDGLYVVPGGDIRDQAHTLGQVSYGVTRETSTGDYIELARWRTFGLGNLSLAVPENALPYIDRVFGNSYPLPIQRRFGISGDKWELADHFSLVSYLDKRTENPTAVGPVGNNAMSMVNVPGVFCGLTRLRNVPPLTIQVELPNPIVGATFIRGNHETTQTIMAITWNSASDTLQLYQSNNLGQSWEQIATTTLFVDDGVADGIPHGLYSFYNRLVVGTVILDSGLVTQLVMGYYDADRATWLYPGYFSPSTISGVAPAKKIVYSGNLTNITLAVREIDEIDISYDNGMTWEATKTVPDSTSKCYDLAAAGHYAAAIGVHGALASLWWSGIGYSAPGWTEVQLSANGQGVSVGLGVQNPFDINSIFVYATIVEPLPVPDPRYLIIKIQKSNDFVHWNTVYQETLDLWGEATPPLIAWTIKRGTFTTDVKLDGYHVWVYARLSYWRRVTYRSIDGGISWERFITVTGPGPGSDRTTDIGFSEFIVSPNDPSLAVIVQEI